MNCKNKKITVVCGGISTEREVSLRSGEAVYNALKEAGYPSVDLFDLRADNIAGLIAQKPDLAFLALHGYGGEDGCIQGALELAGIKYTGSGVAASAVCMNKILTKKLLSYHGIPTPDFVIYNREECADIPAIAEKLTDRLGLPMVLKSPCQGSSIGVVIASDRQGVEEGIREIFSYGDSMLAEMFADGTELTLPITGNTELTVYPAVEITSENEFYDYTSKYTLGLSHHIIPARIDEDTLKKAEELGMRAYRAAGCRGFSRIDCIVDRKRGPMVIEINTIPGMTDMSLFPDSARHAGVSFAELADRIVQLAFED